MEQILVRLGCKTSALMPVLGTTFHDIGQFRSRDERVRTR
jgi:hypothetical protein